RRASLVWGHTCSTVGGGGRRPPPRVRTACPLSVVGNAGGVATWPYLSILRSKLPHERDGASGASARLACGSSGAQRQAQWMPLSSACHLRQAHPMTDSLGFRKKFGVIAPSTNTSVQPEFEAMRPRGVTNH